MAKYFLLINFFMALYLGYDPISLKDIYSLPSSCLTDTDAEAQMPAEINRLANHLLVRYEGESSHSRYTDKTEIHTNSSIEQNLDLPSEIVRTDIQLSS